MGHFLQVVQEESHNHEVPDPRISCLIRARCPSEQLLRPDQGLRSSGVHLLHRLLAGLRNSAIPASPKVIRPTTDSALAYMKEYFGEDLCSAAAQAYLESILNGGDAAEANAAAASAYKAASRAGATITPGSPCEAAKTSFVRNYNSGKDV